MCNSFIFKGKRVRRQVQYFQPGQEEITNMGDDDEYAGDDGPNAGSDNEYLGEYIYLSVRWSNVVSSSFLHHAFLLV